MMKITLRKDDVYRGYLILVNPDHLLRNAMAIQRLGLSVFIVKTNEISHSI